MSGDPLDDTAICPACNGSGSGVADTCCGFCGGCGGVPTAAAMGFDSERRSFDALVEALEPFANVAKRIRETQPKSDAWLEKVLFYMGTDDDPTKWSLTGRAFDKARAAITLAKGGDA